MTVEGTNGSPDRCPRCGNPRRDGVCARCLLQSVLDDEATLDVASGGVPGGEAVDAERLPREVGRYRLVALIARGASGAVYRAWQPDLQREVAVKMLLPEHLAAPAARARFEREAEAMAQLDHPGILPIHEVGNAAGQPFFAMKLATGGNLADRAASLRGRHRDIAALLARIARAVGYAHQHGILHRDLKPSNIVFDAADNPLVTDFGLARYYLHDSSLTGVDAIIGTPRYAAPESLQVRGCEPLPAADVYGLGAILYELLTGAAPFAAVSPLQILQQRGLRPLPAPRQLDPRVPVGLDAICRRCLEKMPGDRYLDGADLAAALETWLVKGGAWRWPTLGLPSRRRQIRLAIGLLIGVVAAAGMGYWLLREPIPMPDPAWATRTVAVTPDRVHMTPTSVAAARRLAAALRVAPPLRLLPFAAGMQAVRTDTIGFETRSDAAAAAFLNVTVAARTDAAGYRVQVNDDLREETLYEDVYQIGDEGRVARAIAAALAAKRHAPVPESTLSRRDLADLLHAIWLLQRPQSATNREATVALQRVIEAHPQLALPRVWLAYAYTLRSEAAFWADSAIDEAARARRADPTLGMASKIMGLAYQRKGWLSRAVAAYEEADRLGTNLLEKPLGWIYYRQGRLADSYAMYRRLVRFDTDEPAFGLSLAAHVLFAVGADSAAVPMMQATMQHTGEPGRRRLLEAELAYYGRDWAACRRLAEGLPSQLGNGYASAGTLAQRCALGAGATAAALGLAEASLEVRRDPDTRAGDPPELAVAILRLQIDPHADVAGLLAAARRDLQAAVDGGSEYPEVWLRLAAVQHMTGEAEASAATLARAMVLGLTIHRGNRLAVEFLPFADDPQFAALRARSAAALAGQRPTIEALLAHGVATPVNDG